MLIPIDQRKPNTKGGLSKSLLYSPWPLSTVSLWTAVLAWRTQCRNMLGRMKINIDFAALCLSLCDFSNRKISLAHAHSAWFHSKLPFLAFQLSVMGWPWEVFFLLGCPCPDPTMLPPSPISLQKINNKLYCTIAPNLSHIQKANWQAPQLQ